MGDPQRVEEPEKLLGGERRRHDPTMPAGARARKPRNADLANCQRTAIMAPSIAAAAANAERGRSSGVEHNLAKVGVEGSNPFARSNRSKS